MDKGQEERHAAAVFSNTSRFTAPELEALRSNQTGVATVTGGGQTDKIMARLQVELIDSIQRLDDTSTRLITTTNSLTQRILCLTYVTVGLAVVGIAIAIAPLFHH